MIYYTSDLHFGHANCINFDHRPFKDTVEMEEVLINNWNQTVTNNDSVYILGDFSFRLKKDPGEVLTKLHGHKHLILGNHDYAIKSSELALSCFESVDKMAYINDGEKLILMCHFPIASWNKQHYGAYHFYGHIHAHRGEVYEFMKQTGQAFNVGCMINHYKPFTADEVIANNLAFQINMEHDTNYR